MLCDICKKESSSIIVSRKFTPQISESFDNLFESEINTEHLCPDCIHKKTKWSELEFCNAMDIYPISQVGNEIIYKQYNQRSCCGD